MAKLPKRATQGIVAVVVVALVAGVLYFVLSGNDTRSISADFDEGIGVYPGTPVKVLGVDVGEVSSVKPKGASVHIVMDVENQYKLPSDATAVEVANSLVSDRYIQLSPYSGSGPTLPAGANIPLNRTSSPAERDDIYKARNNRAPALGPNGANKNGALQDLLHVAAANLTGNGKAIGTSIDKLSQAAQTLANNKGDLFATVKNLQLFTQTLQQSDAAVRHFEEQLATVSNQLAGERADFGQALKLLGTALNDVATFVRTNNAKFHTGIKGLEGVTGLLLREKQSLNEALAIAPYALANIVHAYQPDLGVIATRGNLASLTDPGQLCQVFADLSAGQLKSLLGDILAPVYSACTQVLSKLPGGLTLPTIPGLDLKGLTGQSAGQVKLSKDEIVPAVHAAVDDAPVGGLITGGGK
ncbi:MAG: MCE family protein [Jatrophihabitans sp.]|uniref:MCE family protein n=1 Tax=Jatrophihabitans sp. TaxID=1932789 RepID=UPI003F7EAF94